MGYLRSKALLLAFLPSTTYPADFTRWHSGTRSAGRSILTHNPEEDGCCGLQNAYLRPQRASLVALAFEPHFLEHSFQTALPASLERASHDAPLRPSQSESSFLTRTPGCG